MGCEAGANLQPAGERSQVKGGYRNPPTATDPLVGGGG